MAWHETAIGPHRLIEGDCLEVLAALPEASVDVVVTSPPRTASDGKNFREAVRERLKFYDTPVV